MIFAPRFSHDTKPVAFGVPAVAVEWLWVSSPYATFGLGLSADGTVVETAEIATWLIGFSEDEAREALREDDPNVQIVSLTEFAAANAS